MAVYRHTVRSHKAQCPRLYALGALCSVSQHQHGHAERGCLLLDAPRVGENEIRTSHPVVKIHHVGRLCQKHLWATVQHLVYHLSDNGIAVHGKDGTSIAMLAEGSAQPRKHAPHRLSPAFSSVKRNQQYAALSRPLQNGVAISLPNRVCHGIQNRVSRYKDTFALHVLRKKVSSCLLGWSKMQVGKLCDETAVELLGKRLVLVIRAQASLHVTDGNMQIIGRKSRCHRSRGISVNEHRVGSLPLHNVTHPAHHPLGHVKERLPLSHDSKIILGAYAKGTKHAVKHGTVLSRYAHRA